MPTSKGIALGITVIGLISCQPQTLDHQSSTTGQRLASPGENLESDNQTLVHALDSLASLSPETTSADTTSHTLITYDQYELANGMIHFVTIPDPSRVKIEVSLAEDLSTVEQQAREAGAIAAINAGFFDPHNQQTTSYVMIDGVIVADPRENSRLVDNSDLAPYMDAILNRSEFRGISCADSIVYTIASHNDAIPDPLNSECMLDFAVGGGPQLLPNLQSVEEGFLAYDINGNISRDAIGSLSPNARSAVGIKETGELVMALVAQRPSMGDRTGLSLSEFADFLTSKGVRYALNLDGGSSSSLYINDTIYYGRFDTDGNPIQRPVKSVLLVRPFSSESHSQ